MSLLSEWCRENCIPVVFQYQIDGAPLLQWTSGWVMRNHDKAISQAPHMSNRFTAIVRDQDFDLFRLRF